MSNTLQIPQVAKFDTPNTCPAQQIITRMHQALISHYSAHGAQQPHNKAVKIQSSFIHKSLAENPLS